MGLVNGQFFCDSPSGVPLWSSRVAAPDLALKSGSKCTKLSLGPSLMSKGDGDGYPLVNGRGQTRNLLWYSLWSRDITCTNAALLIPTLMATLQTYLNNCTGYFNLNEIPTFNTGDFPNWKQWCLSVPVSMLLKVATSPIVNGPIVRLCWLDKRNCMQRPLASISCFGLGCWNIVTYIETHSGWWFQPLWKILVSGWIKLIQ